MDLRMRKKPKKLVLDLRPKEIEIGEPCLVSLFRGLNNFTFRTNDLEFISDDRKVELRKADCLICSYSKKQGKLFKDDKTTFMNLDKAVFIMEIELNKILKGEISND